MAFASSRADRFADASLDEVGDVLRHRSRMTTTIYAKYDLDDLRSIARRWPVGPGLLADLEWAHNLEI